MAYKPVICYSQCKNYICRTLSRTLEHKYEANVAEILHSDSVRYFCVRLYFGQYFQVQHNDVYCVLQ